MLTLGLDTTGGYCTAAIVNANICLAQKSENIGRGHAERLAPMVQEVLADADVNSGDIERIAVCTGPGSFTGLRVALAFAKGFALPRKIPVIGLSALEVLAAQMDPHKEKRIVSIADVRRGQLCWAAYDKRIEIRKPVTQDTETAIKAIQALGYDGLAGDGAVHMDAPSDITIVSGPALAWLSQKHAPAAYPPEPLYSRAPDAKLPGGITPPVSA